MSDFLTRDDLLKPVERRYKEFDVQRNGSVKRCRIRSLTERERSEYELSGVNDRGNWRRDKCLTMKSHLIALCVVGENGEPVLNQDDVRSLMDQDGSFTGAIYDECVKHTGVDALDVEKTAKNSPGDPAG